MEASSATVNDSLVGRVLAGKFQIEAFVGAGAMGSVYRARQLALDKVVAIKVLKPELATEAGFAARFKREAKAASSLDHPNSVLILDFGVEPDNLMYMAMEFLAGQNLSWLVSTAWPLPDDQIVSIMCQALSALARAHDVGVVHRDLKPDNIMILGERNDDGHPVVKVCDFGIAKLITRKSGGETRALTNLGMVLGTPEFMSPEQGRGEELDGRSDIYSLGVILFQILTGQLPFDSETPLGLVYKHAMEPLRPPIECNPNANPRLDGVVRRAMEKRREDRFQSARDMRAALVSALDPSTAAQKPYRTLDPIGVQRPRAAQSGEMLPVSPSKYDLVTAQTTEVAGTFTPPQGGPTFGGRHKGRRTILVVGAVFSLAIPVAGVALMVSRSTGHAGGPAKLNDTASEVRATTSTASVATLAATTPLEPPAASVTTTKSSAGPKPSASAVAGAGKPVKRGGGNPAAHSGGEAAAPPSNVEPTPVVVAAPPQATGAAPSATETGSKKPALDPGDPWKR